MADPVLTGQAAGLVALLAASAFFSMSETALISVDRFAVRHRAEEGSARAKVLDAMLEKPERILSTVLVGNNLVNIGAASLATVIALDLFGSKGAAIATGVMTFLVLVFAEITPKTLAVRQAMPISLFVVRPLQVINGVLWPIAAFMSGAARLLLAPFGVKLSEKSPFITQEQIEAFVRAGVSEGEVEQFEQDVIEELFDFTETEVDRVMTPRERVRYVGKDTTLDEALQLVGQTGHSRIPIADGDFDHVLGFVHAKDLLRFSDVQLKEHKVTECLRAVLFAQAHTPADKVLVRMQREHKLLAVIQDPDGHNTGIATVEDLLEELVGEIHDEFDPIKRPLRRDATDPEEAAGEAANASSPEAA